MTALLVASVDILRVSSRTFPVYRARFCDFGYLFFNELPGIIVHMGAAVIIGSTSYLSYAEARRAKKQLAMDTAHHTL